jgi:Family of unknown function (DUF6325)
MIGPVQVVVVGFDHPRFSGEVIAEFSRLDEAGIVRLVDLLLVSRAEDGTFETVTHDKMPSHFGGLAAGVLARAEDEDVAPSAPEGGGSTWSLADAVPPRGTAAVALIEHRWASPLRDAILRNGGRPLDETWLARDEIDRLERMIAERGS